MQTKKDFKQIYDWLEETFPNASCELDYHNTFELLIATVLSAQTTDKAVNKITPILFTKYPTASLLSKATFDDVVAILKPLGLANNKAKNIINLSIALEKDFNGIVPSERELLESLPGVGRKTASVVLSEGFGKCELAVDTHVERVAKRLDLVDEDASIKEVEDGLKTYVEEKDYHHLHHLLIFFGRYLCKAKNPECKSCIYQNKCKNNKND